MAEKPPPKPAQFGTPLEADQVFRPGGKGAWHLLAHQEYGVVWSHCGIRALQKDCQAPKEPVYVRDLCGTCARAAKEKLGSGGEGPEGSAE